MAGGLVRAIAARSGRRNRETDEPGPGRMLARRRLKVRCAPPIPVVCCYGEQGCMYVRKQIPGSLRHFGSSFDDREFELFPAADGLVVVVTRHPVGPDAEAFLGWRASLTDEQWVEWGALPDDEWYARVASDFGLDVHSKRRPVTVEPATATRT